MPKKISDDAYKECTKTCNSVRHIRELTALVCLPKNEVSDEEIASYLMNTSFCFVKNMDEVGYTVLHAAASFGRRALCEWLVQICEANVNVQDKESGYTPLHSSIYFGQINIAVSLIKHGADLSICDKNTNTALDLVAEEFDVTMNTCPAATEVYTWGTNSNYTIGFSNEHSKVVPMHLEYFEKKKVIQVCMQKFHTLFVTEAGKVFGCGLTQGGRLGISKEHAILVPQPITNFGYNHVHCLSVAAGRNHSVFFTLVDKEYKVFTCGLNVYHQLGILPAPDRVTVPTEITKGNWNGQIRGVAASTFHTVIWTQADVYCCGYHGGQLGITQSDELTVSAWTKLPIYKTNIEDDIDCVVVSDAATVVSVNWVLHIFHKYEKIKIVIPDAMSDHPFRNNAMDGSHINTLKIAVYGGVLDIKKGKKLISDSISCDEKLSIARLSGNSELFYYEEKKSKFMKCAFTKKTVFINDFILNKRGLTIVSSRGFAYICTLKGVLENDSCSLLQDDFLIYNGVPTRLDSSPHLFSSKHGYCIFDCDRIPLISRAIKVSSNPEGDNYAIIQVLPVFSVERKCCELSLPDLVLNDLDSFFDKTMKYETGYDVIYKVDNKMFPAHRYIVSSRCELLGTLPATEEVDDVETVEVFGIQPEIFRLILQYIYTLSCDLLTNKQSIEIPKPANPIQFAYYKKHDKDDGNEEYTLVQCSKLKIITRNVIPYTKYLAKCLSLFDLLDSLEVLNGDFEECDLKRETHLSRFLKDKNVTLGFLRDYYPSLCDVKLISSNKVEMYAHKCILMIHSEYFAVLLDHMWTKPIDGVCEIDIPLKNHVLNELLDFCYKGVLTENLTFNSLCELLIVADQFLMPVLKGYCESYLVDHIDLQNVQSVLQFAEMYNCKNLRKQCIKYIICNLVAVLEHRVLEDLNDNLLKEICEQYEFHRKKCFYKNSDVPVFKRTHPNVPNVTEIKKIHKESPTDIYAEENNNMIFKMDEQSNERFKLSAKLTKKSKKRKSRPSMNNGMVIPSTPVSTDNFSNSHTADYTTSEVLNADNLKEDWSTVEKSSKGLKSRLKMISTINNFPDILECKDDFISLQAVQAADRITEHSPSQSFIENELTISPRSQMCMRVDLWDLLSKSSRRPRRHSSSSQQSSEPLEQYCSSTSPKQTSPWNKQEAKETSFTDIVASELRQKKHTKINTIKCKSKRFEHMEMEDKAIQELIAFYGVNIVDDERMSVTRVLPNGVSAPQWIIPTKKKNDLQLNALN